MDLTLGLNYGGTEVLGKVLIHGEFHFADSYISWANNKEMLI